MEATVIYLIISFTFGALLGLAIGARLYQRDLKRQQDWDRALDPTVWVREEDIATLHWLASNGFRRLLFRGAFQTREKAERAHEVLDSLESLLPTRNTDASVDRLGNIGIFFPDGPLSKPSQLVKELWEAQERSQKELEKEIYRRYSKSE
jgi:hypothetical protein